MSYYDTIADFCEKHSQKTDISDVMLQVIVTASNVLKVFHDPVSIIRILSGDGHYIIKAEAEGKLSSTDARNIYKVFKVILERLTDKFVNYIMGHGEYADPGEILQIMQNLMKTFSLLQKKSRIFGLCSPKSPCWSESCPIRKTVRWLKIANKNFKKYSSQLSAYKSREDFLKKTFETNCQVCQFTDLRVKGDFIFLLNCRHMFCEECFGMWCAQNTLAGVTCPLCRQKVESVVSSSQFNTLKQRFAKSRSLSQQVTRNLQPNFRTVIQFSRRCLQCSLIFIFRLPFLFYSGLIDAIQCLVVCCLDCFLRVEDDDSIYGMADF